MNIETTNADFRRAITMASKVLGNDARIPILSTLRCRANGKLEVTGTDLDMQISVSVPRAKGPEAAFCLMAPRTVMTSVNDAGGKEVAISVDNGAIGITSGAFSLKVGTLPSDDFPHDGDRPLDAHFSATLSPAMVASLSRVAAAISKEETRYYLNGVNISRIEGGLFRLAATDGHRLQWIDIALPDATGDVGSIIIHTKTVRLLRELAGKASGDVKLTVGSVPPPNREESTAPGRSGLPRIALAFDAGGAGIVMRAKLIDGTYPDYSRVIPTQGNKQMLFNVAELRRALKGVSGHSKNVRAVRIVLGKDTAAISAKYVEFSIDAASTVSCQNNAPGFEISFNGQYLLEMIEAVQGEEVAMSCLGTSGPMLVRNPSDTAWGGVLMPMMV